MTTTHQHIKLLTQLRNGDRKQGWDAQARARAVEAILDHYSFKGTNRTEAFLDFAIAHLQLIPRKELP